MKAALQAHHWRGTGAAALVLAVVGLLSRATFVQLPFLQEAVPARVLVAIGAAVVLAVPLCGSFADLSHTLPREGSLRVVRVVAAGVVGTLAYAPSAIGVAEPLARADAALFGVLTAAAVLAVVVVGDRAWFLVLALGMTALVVDSAATRPLATLLLALPPVVVPGALVVAGGTYLWRGPAS